MLEQPVVADAHLSESPDLYPRPQAHWVLLKVVRVQARRSGKLVLVLRPFGIGATPEGLLETGSGEECIDLGNRYYLEEKNMPYSRSHALHGGSKSISKILLYFYNSLAPGQGPHSNCIFKLPVFSLSDRKFHLCQFT